MSWNYWKIYTVKEFEVQNVPQVTIRRDLDTIGTVEISFFKGFNLSVLFQGVILTPNLNGRNPFYKNGVAAYIDEKGQIWVGKENESNL